MKPAHLHRGKVKRFKMLSKNALFFSKISNLCLVKRNSEHLLSDDIMSSYMPHYEVYQLE